MPRKRKNPADAAEVKRKAEAVARGRDLLGPMNPSGKKKKKSFTRGLGKDRALRLIRDVDEMLEDGSIDLERFTSKHWVALFCWMHEAIYDVSCVEEVRREWNVAAQRAESLLAEEFDGDEEAFLAYVQWTAKEEERIEMWRRSNRRSGRRAGWRDFFLLRKRLTEYRIDCARREGPA